ncbi:MAG: alpha/beta hydrolase [Gammaproteobacteria bacterium]|nr:alpha/beta hydrolase [Gammaproteobacteria bacterium]
MTPHRGYCAPRWLRNPHLQSALSSMPMRRAGGLRALARAGAQTTEHIVDAGDGVRLFGLHSAVPGREPKGLVLLLHGWEGSADSGYMRHTAAHLIESGLAAPDAGIPLVHAAAVCPAVDPSAVMHALETGNKLYHWYFMKKWRTSLRKKRLLFPDQHDFDDAVLSRDMRGLTRWLVERHTQMGDVEEYFSGYAVAGGRLSGLTIPVSVLAAADDPIIPVDTLQALQLPAHSTLVIAEHGGHCGFIEGPSLRGFAERWVSARLEAAI